MMQGRRLQVQKKRGEGSGYSDAAVASIALKV